VRAARDGQRRCASLAAILELHDADEEGPAGVYAECEEYLGELLSQALAERARAFPEVRVAPYREIPNHEGEKLP